MWLLPLLLIGAIAYVARKSPRERVPPSRQLPPPPMASSAPPNVAGVPGPIAALGEFLLAGQQPPPKVILCAIAEAEALGQRDLADAIVRAFGMPNVPELSASPRERGARRGRGTCVLPPPSSAAAIDQPPAIQAPLADVPPPPPPPRMATAEEALSMLHADPQAFLSMVATGRPPSPPPEAEASPSAPVSAPTPAAAPAKSEADGLLAQLAITPGHASAGIVLDPNGGEIFEVDWLRGFPIPPLPPYVDGRPVQVVFVDTLPHLQPQVQAQATGLPPEVVAQMQEAAGLHAAADQTRAIAPGSPIPGIPDEAWRQFVMRLEREVPTFNSTRHVGQYRHRRERLAELGIHPGSILGSAEAQRHALDSDLVDAHERASAGGLVGHVGHGFLVPGYEGRVPLSLSGLLGVIQCAGLEGAVSWLEKPTDRKRYPHTTQAFLRTNNLF